MIPFASQRGSGQDLATHLLNAQDNEYLELAGLRGAVADDLHGAFAEWEAEASAMTKCTNYLYSLSVNPDPAQGPMSRDLYDDYIDRVEAALGLDGQPRAVVFHIKEDKAGVPREHCHVVWSRIDVQEMKAIHMAFDHDKLMTVTRQFAREHDIELAPGYHKLEDRKRQTYRQLSLYEKAQQDEIGLTKEERRALVTELWNGRDTPAAFIKALEYHGYTLATGRRPFVLVDIFRHTNSLPKLLDDKAANTKAICEFLGDEYGEGSLPSVQDAQALATEHRKALKAFKQSQVRADELDQLKEIQTRRRNKLKLEIEALREKHKQARMTFEARQRDERDTLRGGYLEQGREIRRERQENRPQGLAGFLAKVSGVELVQRKVHKYQDRKRYDAFLEEKHALQDRHAATREEHQRAQEMQALDLERKRRALEQTEQREIRSLETAQQKRQFVRNRAAYEHMPSPQLELSPPGRKAVLHKAKNRFIARTEELGNRPTGGLLKEQPSSPDQGTRSEFNRAALSDERSGRAPEELSGNKKGIFPAPDNVTPTNPVKPTDTGMRKGVRGEALRDKQIPRDGKYESSGSPFNRPNPRESDARSNPEAPPTNQDTTKRPQASALSPEKPYRALNADNHPDPALPQSTQDNETLAPTFDSAASRFPEPASSFGESTDPTPPLPTQQELPTKEYGPAPPDNEPDRER